MSEKLLVLLHELGCASRSWGKVPDLPGWEIWAPEIREPVTLASAMTVTEIGRRNPVDVLIAGHGMGSAIGVLAAEYLEVPLISVEGSLAAPDCERLSHALANGCTGLFPAPVPAEFTQWLGEWDSRQLRTAARSLVKWSENGELLKRWERIPEKLCIHGDNGCRGIRPSRHVAGAGHWVMLDQPAAFWRAVRDFMKETSWLT